MHSPFAQSGLYQLYSTTSETRILLLSKIILHDPCYLCYIIMTITLLQFNHDALSYLDDCPQQRDFVNYGKFESLDVCNQRLEPEKNWCHPKDKGGMNILFLLVQLPLVRARARSRHSPRMHGFQFVPPKISHPQINQTLHNCQLSN